MERKGGGRESGEGRGGEEGVLGAVLDARNNAKSPIWRMPMSDA